MLPPHPISEQALDPRRYQNQDSRLERRERSGNSASVTYNPDLTTSSATGSNSDTTSFGYSSSGFRPQTTTAPDNSVTTYGYSDMHSDGTLGQLWAYPYTSTVTTPGGRLSKTIVDGFGRTTFSMVRQSAGPPEVWITTATQYNPCSCSATGKATKVSRPYSSNANGDVVSGSQIYWNTTTSDALGRTISVVLTDSNQTQLSQTQYGYAIENDAVNGANWLGTQTTITDPAGKQKRYLYDGFGNLLRVDEPNTSNVLSETARYSYNAVGA